MPSSQLEICNSALSKIGAAVIQSIDEDSREAQACKLRYAQCKRVVLRKHPWNCATDRLTLAPTTTTPAFDFPYQFQLPANSLRVLRIEDDESYRIEGRSILADTNALKIKFIYDAPENLIDDLCAEAIACYLAWDIAYKITQKPDVRDAMWKLYIQALRDARSVDGQEETDQILEANDLIDSRGGESVGRSNR